MDNNPIFKEIIIVGAGPFGLSCIHTLQKFNYTDYLLIDFGKELEKRDKYDNIDAFIGEGGAGLYSDGKFSFFPCGTKVWDLPNRSQLFESYTYLEEIFQKGVNFQIPPFVNEEKYIFNGENCCFKLKEYPSYYLSFEDRKKLINFLTNSQRKILLGQKLIGLEKIDQNNYLISIKDVNSLLTQKFTCKYLVLGGGKYFPVTLARIYKFPQIFRRYEFGGRILAENNVLSSIFLKNYQEKNLIDPKWICTSSIPNVEFRTFCICVDGEVILCKYDDFKGYSGRADCNPTGFTNFGFNVIVKQENLIDFEEFFMKASKEYEISLEDALDENLGLCERLYGEKAGNLFRVGLNLFMKQFETQTEKIKIIGPTIEGVGYYPHINDDLSLLDNENIYIVGDSTGIFRGIIPSMLSGIYVALSILNSKLKR